MQSFLRGVEVWVPDPSDARLRLVDGLHQNLDAVVQAGRELAFARGEGLPGLAWEREAPVVLAPMDDPRFLRAGAAREHGLICGIALPLFGPAGLRSVVVFFFSREQEAQAGAVEVWRAVDGNRLVLADGYYGALAGFAGLSRQLEFPRGRGLPGRVWATRAPQVVGDLGRARDFQRAEGAREAGLRVGLGVPCPSPTGRDHVVTFLSAGEMPIAHRIEVWVPGGNPSRLVLEAGESVEGPLRRETYQRMYIWSGDGAIGKAWADGVPRIARDIVSEPILASGQPASRRVTSMIALPFAAGGADAAVVALYI